MNLPEKYFLFRRKKQYVLYVGNAYPHKNLEKLIEALNIVISEYPNIFLILVGGEDYFYKRLKEKVKEMELEDVVVFWGPADRKELANLYKNATILVFPSFMEGFGLPAVEAMAEGLLVLCSDIPVFHEVLGSAAVYFNPYDANDMADKMSDVLNNPQKYENFKTLGFEQVRRYSWQKLAHQTLVVYQSVLK